MRVLRIVWNLTFRTGMFVVALVFFALAIRVLFGGTEVRAAMDTYYPQFCLGGWEHPRAASGEPETDSGDDESSFTFASSAYLAPDVSAQIFCGYFPIESRANPPVSAKVRLVWNLAGADSIPIPSAVPLAPVVVPGAQEEPASTPTDSAGEASSTPAEPPAPEAPLSQTETEQEPALSEPAKATSSEQPAPPTDHQTPAAQETTPVPPPDSPATAEHPVQPAQAEGTTTSFIDRATQVAGAWVRSYTAVAHAQEDVSSSVPLSLSDWFMVSYSLDGVRWKSIGRVNAANWRDFTASIPLSSWEDLQNVQIMVSALPSLTDRPPVYLDGMELRVETDPTFVESATAAAGAASDILDSAFGAVLSLVPGHEDPQPQQGVAEQPAPEQISVAKAKKRVLQFTVRGKPLPALTQLPWQEAGVRETLASTTQTTAPDIARSDDGRSFIVSGSCSSAYAVVIAYPEADDYLEHPRNALVNVATPCESGHYTFNLGLLPESTRSGTLYLLIGAQGETGTWTPASALLPITIDPVEIEE